MHLASATFKVAITVEPLLALSREASALALRGRPLAGERSVLRSTAIPMRLSLVQSKFLLLASTLAACATSPSPGADFSGLRAADSLALERSPCVGRCPVYRVVVSRSGRFRLEPGVNRGWPDYDTVVQSASIDSIPHTKVEELFSTAARIRFDTLPGSIQDAPDLCRSLSTDAPSALVTLWLPGRVIAVRDYHGCEPGSDALRRFEEQIDEVTGVQQRMRRARPSSPQRPQN